jgi:hypothetical protein
MAVPVYGNETWTMTKRDQSQTLTMVKNFMTSVVMLFSIGEEEKWDRHVCK